MVRLIEIAADPSLELDKYNKSVGCIVKYITGIIDNCMVLDRNKLQSLVDDTEVNNLKQFTNKVFVIPSFMTTQPMQSTNYSKFIIRLLDLHRHFNSSFVFIGGEFKYWDKRIQKYIEEITSENDYVVN